MTTRNLNAQIYSAKSKRRNWMRTKVNRKTTLAKKNTNTKTGYQTDDEDEKEARR